MEKKKKVTCKNYTLLLCQSVFIVRIDSYILMMKIHSGIRSKEANQIVECGSKSCCVEHRKKKKRKHHAHPMCIVTHSQTPTQRRIKYRCG